MSSKRSNKNPNSVDTFSSDAGGDVDVHISKKRRGAGADPKWQVQLQNASGGASIEQLQRPPGILRHRIVNANIVNDHTLAINPQWLPQEPAGAETDRMQLPLRSNTASRSITSYRAPHFQTPDHNQADRAISIAPNHMAPSSRLAASQNSSSHLTDTTSLASPADVWDIAAPNQSDSYDYNFQALANSYNKALNFTAVEIITFLPTLYCNSSIARRFVNNGLENPIHAEITEVHRVYPRAVADIGNDYQNALRPSDWRRMAKEDIKTLWTRKNQKKPHGWDARNISMNAFVPDRIIKQGVRAPAPTSVPFSRLMQGVKKTPTGNDAADLTRAIEFANSEEAKKIFPGRNLIFPDDLIDILRTIGPTLVTEQHRDKDVVKRYRKLYEERKKLKKDMPAEKNETSNSSSRRTRNGSRQDPDGSVVSEISFPLLKSSPKLPPQGSQTSHPSVFHSPHNAAQTNQDISSDSPMTRIPLKSPREHHQCGPLLRDLEPESLSDSDTSAGLASAIRYTRRPDQEDVNRKDDPDYLAQSRPMLQVDEEIALIPSDDHTFYEQLWEESHGEWQRAMDGTIDTLQQDLGVHVSPPPFTAEDYEELFGESAPEHLAKGIRHDEQYEVTSDIPRMQIDSGQSD